MPLWSRFRAVVAPLLLGGALGAASLLGGCSSNDTCERITGIGGTVEEKITGCAIGVRLKLGLLDDLEKYKTACRAASIVCGESSLAPLRAAADCIERVEPCVGDTAAREAASQELTRCREELARTPPETLKSCLGR